MYEDFQCPFCGKFDRESEQMVRNTYVADGRVKFVYRDFAFLGPESIKAAEAARCAGDQGKFWEYHDYLFSHQNGENQGGFADPKLKSFAVGLGLNASILKRYSRRFFCGINGLPVKHYSWVDGAWCSQHHASQ